MSLLTICQTIADEIGFDRPGSIVSNTDPTARQLLALMNREGQFLVRGADVGHEWGATIRDKSQTVTSGTAVYQVPVDFLKFVNDTMWDTTNDWPMIGPLTSQQWEALKRGWQVTGPRKYFRLTGESDGLYAAGATQFYVEVTPTPTNNTDTFFYEYVSTGFARQNSDVAAASFDNDSDNPILPEQLFILGGIWRWRRAKGLDYTTEKIEYDRYLEQAIAQDKGARKLSLVRRNLIGPHFLSYGNVPETNFGV